MRCVTATNVKLRLIQTTAIVAFVAFAGGARAQTIVNVPTVITVPEANVVNLLGPFLSLNGSSIGQQTLSANLSNAISVNNTAAASPVISAVSISDKTIFSGASTNIMLSNESTRAYGPGANLAGPLPDQLVQGTGTITPTQPFGGLGQLGTAYQTAVRPGNVVTPGVVSLLTNAINFTFNDLGVAKNYFANGGANNTFNANTNTITRFTAVAPNGMTLPTFNGLPNTSTSVYDSAYAPTGVYTAVGRDVFGSSRPVQVSTAINVYDPTAINGLTTNPAFPSGHTTYAFTDGILIGMMLPQYYQSMLLRASEYGNSRIALGVHYPLDIIGSRALAQYDLSQLLNATNPAYLQTNVATGATALNLNGQFVTAAQQLNTYMNTQTGGCGGSLATCAANNTYNAYSLQTYGTAMATTNAAIYQSRLTYGLPTLSFTQAPREAAPTGGPDASILLATVYGGSSAQAQALANSVGGPLNGSLTTGTINQIIVNTETNAIAAFYGTALSYWSRIDLYAAAGYFSNVIGTINLAPTDVVTTDVTVANTGVVTGTGTIANTTVLAGGALQPGDGTAGSKLTVNGNLAFLPGSLYLEQVSSMGAPFTSVTGSAKLGGTVQVSSPTNSYRFSQPMTILTSTGLSGTRFDGLTTPTGITGALSYTDTNVLLGLISSLAQIPGENGNQRAVGAALDNAFNSTGSSGPLGVIFSGNVLQNLQQASDEIATGPLQVTYNAMTQFMNVMLDPGSAGRGAAAPSVTGYAEEDDAANAYAAADRKKRTGSEREAYGLMTKAPLRDVYNPHWSVWAAGFGGTQNTDGNVATGSNNTTSSLYGVAVGADYWFSPYTVAGISMAGGGTSFNVANNFGSGRSDLFQTGVFARHTEGAAYISGALAYGWQDVTTDRTVTIAGLDKLHAEFHPNTYSGRIEGGYRFVAPWIGGNIGITPYAAGQFTTIDLPSYAEAALVGTNLFAMAHASQSATDTRTELGIRTDRSFAMINGVLTLRSRLAWAHDYDPNRAVSATFQSLPGASFVVNGAAQSPNSALTTSTIEWKWLNGWSAGASLEGEFSDVTRSYAGKGVVRYTW